MWVKVFLFIILVLVSIAGLYVLKKKHRLIWGKIWKFEDDLATNNADITEIKKDLILLTEPKGRLNHIMPSQHGEDVYLWHHFKRRNGFFIEIGAYDGVTFSNTYWLEHVGWTGILVEPNPELYKKCLKARPFSKVIHAAITGDESLNSVTLVLPDNIGGRDALAYTVKSDYQVNRVNDTGVKLRHIQVPAMTTKRLLQDVTANIDVLSIDVEGAEMEVLSTFDFSRFRPEVIIIEDNLRGKDKTIYEFMHSKNYTVNKIISRNIIFIPCISDTDIQ